MHTTTHIHYTHTHTYIQTDKRKQRHDEKKKSKTKLHAKRHLDLVAGALLEGYGVGDDDVLHDALFDALQCRAVEQRVRRTCCGVGKTRGKKRKKERKNNDVLYDPVMVMR